MILLSRPWLKVLSALFVNLSAGWYGVVFLTPELIELSNEIIWVVLIRDLFLGTLFLIVAKQIEEILHNDE